MLHSILAISVGASLGAVSRWLLGLSLNTLFPAIPPGTMAAIHSSHFFEQADQPLEVIMAVTADEADRLFARLREENVRVFYVKTPIEFGMTGDV